MNKNELIKFLKENLTINFSTTRARRFDDYLCIEVKLCGETIAKDVNFDLCVSDIEMSR